MRVLATGLDVGCTAAGKTKDSNAQGCCWESSCPSLAGQNPNAKWLEIFCGWGEQRWTLKVSQKAFEGTRAYWTLLIYQDPKRMEKRIWCISHQQSLDRMIYRHWRGSKFSRVLKAHDISVKTKLWEDWRDVSTPMLYYTKRELRNDAQLPARDLGYTYQTGIYVLVPCVL